METDRYNIKLITDYMKENNLTKTSLVKLCKMSVGTLERFLL